jgi:hypothetical protein
MSYKSNIFLVDIILIIEKQKTIQPTKQELADLLIKTNQNEYGNQQKVALFIDNIPDNTTDLIVSVSRDDLSLNLRKNCYPVRLL